MDPLQSAAIGDSEKLDKTPSAVNVSQDSCVSQTHVQHPESYRSNSPWELRLLTLADNFQCQYSVLYPERKPLLLCALNECGVKKFVSTSLRPTTISHPEFFSWEGCASFVADFLSLSPLEPPVDPPRNLFSSTAVLQTQRATCFEFATLLCSLLLGTNYDAYCVSGYATKEMCLYDHSLQDCPLLDTEGVKPDELPPEENKYKLKPQRELKSRFLTQQQQRQEAADKLLQSEKPQADSKQSPADPLHGLRVHCWVLVLSGSCSVQENFFIDPLTGKSHSTDDVTFLGIESVWNHRNYYVNMQDCRDGCRDMVYNLDDIKLWEPVLYGVTSTMQQISTVKKDEESDDEKDEQQSSGFEMPRSWVGPLTISKQDLETRWPGGMKTIRYRKAEEETFASHVRGDGLIRRLTTYKDLECTEVAIVREWFQNRNDHLVEREDNKAEQVTSERFTRGRPFNLLCTDHEMEFSNARVDGLMRRVMSQEEMIETFKDREDFLCYRRVIHQIPGPNDPSYQQEPLLMKVVERFDRNKNKPIQEDVAQRVFMVAQRRIELTYHLEDFRVIASKRCFIKPRKKEDFTANMVSSFQVDPFVKPLKTLTLYEMLLALMKDEDRVSLQIKRSQKEVRDIVACRVKEQSNIQVHFCPWTPTGLSKIRCQRQEMEQQALGDQKKLQEKDYLAPFLIRLGKAKNLTSEDTKHLYHACFEDLKSKLLEQSGLIQARYEKMTRDLQEKQEWYHKNQFKITAEEDEQYLDFCSEKMIQINAAEDQFKMHCAAAAEQYQSLHSMLKKDTRLSRHWTLLSYLEEENDMLSLFTMKHLTELSQESSQVS